jgi:hypothetical protein
MLFTDIFSGLGYSGYATLNGIPIPLLPGNATENENMIKSAGAYHYDPALAVGQIPVKNRRSLPLSFSTFICPRTMPLVKALTYGWRTLGLMDMVGETPFGLFPAAGEGYSGSGYVEELTLTGSPDSLVSLNVNMTCWVWQEVPSLQPLQKMGAALAPMSDAYKPVAGWATIPNFSVILPNAIPMNWSLSLRNNWQYQSFLGGYTQPPNPGLVTAGDLDVTFTIAWLAARNSRPLDTGSLQLQIGVPQIDKIYIDTLFRDPQRAFTGIAGPNEPIKWEASYYGQGSLPRSN